MYLARGVVGYALALLKCLALCPPNDVVVVAFVASGGGVPEMPQRQRAATAAALRPTLALLSTRPEVDAPITAANPLEVKLSGKEAVDTAAQRLVPLFAEVDAHTQR